MATVTVTRALTGSPKRARQVLDDFPNIADWSRGVVRSSTSNKQAGGVGAERRCEFDAKGKQWVEERIIDADAESVTIDIVRGSMPMKEACAVFRIDGNMATAVFDYKVRGLLGAPMGFLMKPMMTKTFRNILEDLDEASQE